MPILKEESLKGLLRQPNIIADHTQEFYDIRMQVEGKPPQSHNAARLFDADIEGDSIIFHFLSGATDANPNKNMVYPPEHQYLSVNPDMDFALERNPSKTYDIDFKFEGLHNFSNLLKSRNQKKKFNPQQSKEFKGGVKGVSFEEALAWLWDTEVKIWCSSPAFHWSGQNYSLSQLHSALKPTNIPPQKPRPGKFGWADLKDSSLFDKHLAGMINYLGWYLGQMARMLLKKIKNPTEPSNATPMPNPEPIKPSTGTRPPTAPPPPAPEPQEAPMAPPVNAFGVQATPQVDIKQRTPTGQPNPQTNIPIKHQYPGLEAQDPATYDPITDELRKESTMWKKTPTGYQIDQTIKGKAYITKLITEIKHAENSLLLLDKKAENFVYRLTEKVDFDTRYAMYEDLQGLDEVTILIEEGQEEARQSGLIEEVLDFIKECPYPVITFESTLMKPKHAKLVKALSEVIQLALPSYTRNILYKEGTIDYTTILLKGKKLFEAEDTGEDIPLPEAPEGNEVPTGPNKRDAEGGQDKENLQQAPEQGGQQAPEQQGQPEGSEQPNLPEKKVVIAFGSFNPVTKDHLALIQKVKATQTLHKCEAFIIIQADPFYSQDKESLEIRRQILDKLVNSNSNSKISVMANPDITDFYKALLRIYGAHFTHLMVIAGDDEVTAMSSMANEGNSPEGHFKFTKVEVGSYGGDNPDKGECSTQAINAVMSNDASGMDSYKQAIGIPMDDPDLEQAFTNLFNLERAELTTKAGLSESAKRLEEARLKLIYDILLNGEKRKRLMKSVEDGTFEIGYLRDKVPVDEAGQEMPYNNTVALYKPLFRWFRDHKIERPLGVIITIFTTCYKKSKEEVTKDLDYSFDDYPNKVKK